MSFEDAYRALHADDHRGIVAPRDGRKHLLAHLQNEATKGYRACGRLLHQFVAAPYLAVDEGADGPA